MQGKVSVVVPCYNKVDLIGPMLESVAGQKWDNIELILVNDGSTDGTREIIAEWEPMLTSRGYDVVIIDQENSGCCAAVYAGLVRMTGDYFCLVDCDDEIYPEYVSRMAGWLDTHDDYEWTACSYNYIVESGGRLVENPAQRKASQWDSPKLLEDILLWRFDTMSWACMIRVSYVKRSGMIEAFCTERHATYEPCINIPAAALRGKLKFFNEPLYKYNYYAAGLSKMAVFDNAAKYYGDQLYLTEWTLERINLPGHDKLRYITLARLMYKCRLLEFAGLPGYEGFMSELSKDLAKLLREGFVPAPQISADTILAAGYSRLTFAISSTVLGIKYKYAKLPNKTGRIIGYGALGKYGQKDLPELMKTPLCPTVIWDKAASEHTETQGLPVETPDFASLTPDDTVIVLPRTAAVVDELKDVLSRSNSGEVLYYQQLDELLAVHTFHSLLESEFMPHD